MTLTVPLMKLRNNVVVENVCRQMKLQILSPFALMRDSLENVRKTKTIINAVMDQRLAAANAKPTKIANTHILLITIPCVAMEFVGQLNATIMKNVQLIRIVMLMK